VRAGQPCCELAPDLHHASALQVGRHLANRHGIHPCVLRRKSWPAPNCMRMRCTCMATASCIRTPFVAEELPKTSPSGPPLPGAWAEWAGSAAPCRTAGEAHMRLSTLDKPLGRAWTSRAMHASCLRLRRKAYDEGPAPHLAAEHVGRGIDPAATRAVHRARAGRLAEPGDGLEAVQAAHEVAPIPSPAGMAAACRARSDLSTGLPRQHADNQQRLAGRWTVALALESKLGRGGCQLRLLLSTHLAVHPSNLAVAAGPSAKVGTPDCQAPCALLPVCPPWRVLRCASATCECRQAQMHACDARDGVICILSHGSRRLQSKKWARRPPALSPAKPFSYLLRNTAQTYDLYRHNTCTLMSGFISAQSAVQLGMPVSHHPSSLAHFCRAR
jgi:hypothetical protein